MAITANDLRVIVRGTILGQQWENVQWYRLTGPGPFSTADPVQVGEAYWNDVKGPYRACVFDDPYFTFDSVFVAEPGPSGAYAEYSVPVGERFGDRTVGEGNAPLASFNAIGVRLTVGYRVTRPGQKRFCFLTEADVSENDIEAPMLALVEAVALKFSTAITLGAPVALGGMHPEIVRLDPDTDLVAVKQDVTGHLINPLVTSQVSRKRKH
jgi:hypothetical protein